MCDTERTTNINCCSWAAFISWGKMFCSMPSSSFLMGHSGGWAAVLSYQVHFYMHYLCVGLSQLSHDCLPIRVLGLYYNSGIKWTFNHQLNYIQMNHECLSQFEPEWLLKHMNVMKTLPWHGLLIYLDLWTSAQSLTIQRFCYEWFSLKSHCVTCLIFYRVCVPPHVQYQED